MRRRTATQRALCLPNWNVIIVYAGSHFDIFETLSFVQMVLQ